MSANVYIEKFSKIGYISILTKKEKFLKIYFGKFKEKKLFNYPFFVEKIAKDFFCEFESYLNGKKVKFNFPYFLNVSEFYERVYNKLKEVSYGTTISYKELAEKSGNFRAYRAVGTACSNNPLPLIIPCHRVIKTNGELGGFAGGIKIKKTLLKIEGATNEY